MLSFLIRRLLWLVPVLLTVAVITFWLMHRAPGGPWDSAKPLPPVTRANLDAKFGLDKPTWVNPAALRAARARGAVNPLTLARAYGDSQFGHYLAGVVRFDFGPSFQARGTRAVREIIAAKFPVSAKLGAVGLAFAVGVGVPLGAAGALRRGSVADQVTLALSTVGVAVPTFVIAVLLVVSLSSWFGVSPLRRPEEWDGLGRAYLLPGVVLGLGATAVVVRLTRASVLDVLGHDHVRTARAKGLAEGRVVRGHVLRNGLIPLTTVLGPVAAELLTGSIIIETIFGAPGLGREFVGSIGARDYGMIMGTTLFYALVIAAANVAVDVAYGLLDPRVRVRR